MAKCNCAGQTCGCRIIAGEGVTITGSGTARDPWVVTSGGEGGGGSSFVPGDLKDTVSTDTPAGWLECMGQPVSRTGYPNLFAAIGTRWGAGDGFSTFNVPSMAGKFRVGAGPDYALGASGGAETTQLVVGNLPSHLHTIAHTHYMDHQHGLGNHSHSDAHDHGASTSSSNGNHNHTYKRADNDTLKVGSGSNKAVLVPGSADNTNTSNDGAHAHTVSVPGWGGRTDGPTPNTSDTANRTYTDQPTAPNSGSVGSSQPFTNLPPYRAVRVLIKT